MSFKPLAGLFGLAVFAAPALFAIAAPAAPAGDIAAGRQLYAEKGCAACHGPGGEGAAAGPRVADTYAYLKSLAAPKLSPVAQLKGDRVAGRKTYLENGCHACHGSVGQGGGPGPVIAATPMTLAAYHEQLRKPRSMMPAYGPTLMTDQEVADTWAYVKGLPGPRDPANLPPLLRAPGP